MKQKRIVQTIESLVIHNYNKLPYNSQTRNYLIHGSPSGRKLEENLLLGGKVCGSLGELEFMKIYKRNDGSTGLYIIMIFL